MPDNPAEIKRNLEMASDQAIDTLTVFSQMPLATIDDLTAVSGFPRSRINTGMKDLQQLGLAAPAPLGWTLEKVPRWHIPDLALGPIDDLRGPGRQPCSRWHEEWGRSLLLPRLPTVEWGYPAIGAITEMGPMREILWLRGVSLDFAVRCQRGWAGGIWSGPLQRESQLAARLYDLGRNLVDLSIDPNPAWPGLIIILAGDQWQREIVHRVVRSFGPALQDRVSVWCASDGRRTGAAHSGDSRGWVQQYAYPRGMGSWPWAQRRAASPWARRDPDSPDADISFAWEQEGSDLTNRILNFLAQRKDVTREMVQLAMGEKPKGRAVYRRLVRLCEAELASRTQAPGERGFRYDLSSEGRHALRTRDGLPSPRGDGRGGKKKEEKGNPRSRHNRRRHEDLVSRLVAMHMGAGLPAATGERHWEHLGDAGIAPDAIVFVMGGPWGPTWAYAEIELSASGESRWDGKLSGYASQRRIDDFPVLAVCRDAKAEENAHAAGRALGIERLLTTTLDLFSKAPGLGDDGLWSWYGRRVTLDGTEPPDTEHDGPPWEAPGSAHPGIPVPGPQHP